MNTIDLKEHPSIVPQYVEMRNRYVDLLLTEPVTVEGTARWLRDGKVEVRCLVDEDLLKGSVILYFDREGEVAFFAGEPGKGIGTRLLAIVENVAREKGLGRMWARVLTSNEPAGRAFLKAGYALDGTMESAWRGKRHEVHVFRKVLREKS